MESGDLAVFNQFVITEEIWYANYIEGVQPVSAYDFLNDLKVRIPSQPTCRGVHLDEY